MKRGKKVLLIVEDSRVTVYLHSFIPLLGDYEVKEVSQAAEALAKINALEPKLVILDFDYSDMDVTQFLSQIRQKHPKTSLLVLTPDPNKEKELRERGVSEILARPFDLTDLSQSVKKLLPVESHSDKSREYARLLIADDEPDMNEHLEELIRPLGIEVYKATNGEEALRTFKEKGCNLAIVDLRMPKINGAELIKLLEESTNPPKPKAIIVITAGLGDAHTELKRLGYPVLEKPMDLDLLEASVLRACEKFGLALKR